MSNRLPTYRVPDRTLTSNLAQTSWSPICCALFVHCPDSMVNNQSVNNSWKNLLGGLYDTFKQRKPSMKTNCGFMNGIKSSSENLSQRKTRNAINLQPKIMKSTAINGGHTNYMTGQCFGGL